MKRMFIIMIMALLMLVPASMVWSGQVTATMQVTGTVPQAASITVTNLDFGNLSFSTTIDATSTITVTAASGLSYRIGIDKGQNYGGGTFGYRSMTDGSGNYVTYLLAQDAAYTQEWGDDCAGNTYTTGGATCAGPYTGTGSAQNYTVYGRAFQLTSQPAGSYSDTVTVTVVY